MRPWKNATERPPIVPSQSFPACPGPVGGGKPGSSRYTASSVSKLLPNVSMVASPLVGFVLAYLLFLGIAMVGLWTVGGGGWLLVALGAIVFLTLQLIRSDGAPTDAGLSARVEWLERRVAELEFVVAELGAIGRNVARLFGAEPGQEVASDLRRLKQVLETGEVLHSDASVHRGMHPARPARFTSQERKQFRS